MEILEFYKQRVDELSNRERIAKKNLILVSLLRLLVFLLIGFGIYIFWEQGWRVLLFPSIIGFLLFLWLVKTHTDKQRQLELIRSLIKINKEEIQRKNGDWKIFDEGSHFRDASHPYCEDLSIFGKGSLFQYLSRAASVEGKNILAEKLLQPSTDPQEIGKIRKAYEELAEDKIWLQEFMANVRVSLVDKDDKKLLANWVSGSLKVRGRLYNILLLVLLPAISIFMLVLTNLNVITLGQFFLYLILPFAAVGSHLKSNGFRFGQLSQISENLNAYQHLFEMIASREFKSEYFNQLIGSSDGKAIVGALKDLNKIADAINSRNNIFVGIVLNALLVWDLQCDHRLRKWHQKHSVDFLSWFNVVWTVDALGSFATYINNHPHFVDPLFSSEVVLKAQDIAHPLLDESVRINNNFHLTENLRFAIITGANMAGKSTFLRAVGVNMVMARCGSTVCASEFIFEPTEIFSSMQTSDNLSENESFFFSELKRLKQITDRLDSGEKLFLILDEILKGTNSRDKAEGSARFMRRILKQNCNGIIATHDLSLCKLADEFPNVISNKRFEVAFEEDELVFDYKLQAGICENMNATYLLQKMGLTD